MAEISKIKDDALDFLRLLLKTPSVSGNEQAVSSILHRFLEDHGFQIIPSELGNAIGVRGSGHPVLLISSHMDTVPTHNLYREEDGKIYATGAVDCKPSLASLFYGMAINEDFGVGEEDKGTVILAGIVEEETSTRGIEELFKLLDERGLEPDYAIFGEPTGVDRICIGYRGRIVVEVNVKTASGHSSSSWGFDNAAEILMGLYLKIREYINSRNKAQALSEKMPSPPSQGPQRTGEGNYFNRLSCALTQFHSGKVDNSIPGEARGVIDIRVPPGIDAHQLSQTLSFLIESFKTLKRREFPYPIIDTLPLRASTTIEYRIGAVYNGVEVPQNAPIVNALRWAGFKVLKKKITLLKKTGSTFMNLIQEHYAQRVGPKFACIVYGPGDPRLEHTDNEFIELEEYLKAIEIISLFTKKLMEFYRKAKL